MTYDDFNSSIRNNVLEGSIFQNPLKGTSEIIQVSPDILKYVRGKSPITISIKNMYFVYTEFAGTEVTSSQLKEFKPEVFDPNSRPAGHSCNCTMFFLIMKQIGLTNQIDGKGVKGNPFKIKIKKA